ncbi:hypothetical protein K466DRAFT_587325 [Polyporus arcularius HHB13444]|uniref:Uncharacterized protein n=1 Tax=Polyporus arcularius HHB13444 TaxID=1314778 RepID=A0A5C3PK46_9APHY|nr:hypothetical protein K466DRAFT_587325 [Polyporus arcularius HHB13444]
MDRRGATLVPVMSQEHSALGELMAKYSTIRPVSAPAATSVTTPRCSSSARASSRTLGSEPRASSVYSWVDSPPGAPQGETNNNPTPPEHMPVSVVSPQLDEGAGGASPTPSDMEVDGLIQMAHDDDFMPIEALSIPSPPASPPQCFSSPVTDPPATHLIPPDVPWRQPRLVSSDSFSAFVAWERTTIPPKPDTSQVDASSQQGGETHPVVDSFPNLSGLYTIAHPVEEPVRPIDAQAPPSLGGIGDPVVTFLNEISLSPVLAETLRGVGISDEQRMRALGGLHWRMLDRLDKTLEHAGLDPVARLLIRDGLKRRAAQR